jgi:hypothetical protein
MIEAFIYNQMRHHRIVVVNQPSKDSWTLREAGTVTTTPQYNYQLATSSLKAFWGHMGAATIYQNWKKSNPGEYAALNTMAQTSSTVTTPTTVKSSFGLALGDIVIAGHALNYSPTTLP